jgi:hypothetical protein
MQKVHGERDPWHGLATAILTRAGYDAHSADQAKAQEARAWLLSHWFARYLADELDVRREVIVRIVAASTARR